MKVKISFFAVPLFISLLGFYIGNILPTLLVLFQPFFPWVHGFAFVLVIWNEFIGFSFFRFPGFFFFSKASIQRQQFKKSPLRKFKASQKKLFKKSKLSLIFSIRSFHFGFLFGIFVDAFKVGS